MLSQRHPGLVRALLVVVLAGRCSTALHVRPSLRAWRSRTPTACQPEVPRDLDGVVEHARNSVKAALISGKRGMRVEAGAPCLDAATHCSALRLVQHTPRPQTPLDVANTSQCFAKALYKTERMFWHPSIATSYAAV